jgi:hypothetical protein
MKSFQKLTVGEYQSLYRIHKSDQDEMEKSVQSVSILTGKPQWEVEEMPMETFNEQARTFSVLFSTPPADQKPKTSIKINGKKYRICLNPRKITAGQYIDLQVFLKENQIESLHKLMACLLLPLKSFGRVGKYDGENHSKISDGILDCNFMEVQATCVFFLNLWNNSIKAITPYLKQEIQKILKSQNMEPMDLQLLTDGFIIPRA